MAIVVFAGVAVASILIPMFLNPQNNYPNTIQLTMIIIVSVASIWNTYSYCISTYILWSHLFQC